MKTRDRCWFQCKGAILFLKGWKSHRTGRRLLLVSLLCLSHVNMGGCARLPYMTTLVHQDRLVEVALQHEVDTAGYTHPARLTEDELLSVLKGFSLRPQKTVPMRWFGDEVPPKPLFREDEMLALAPWLSAGLQAATGEERVHFSFFAPGMNPSNERGVTAGWIAIRDPYLYITIEYFHTQVPIRKSDQYDYNYPTPPPLAGSYLLYFEPGRYWSSDAAGQRGLEYRKFLASTPVGMAVKSR